MAILLERRIAELWNFEHMSSQEHTMNYAVILCAAIVQIICIPMLVIAVLVYQSWHIFGSV